MTEVTRERCDQFTTELLAEDEPERLRRLFAMIDEAVRDSRPLLPILVGLSLRDRDHYELAEYVFQLGARVPGARHGCLFELSIALSLQGRPEEAVGALNACEAEAPLNAYQQRVFAILLARIDRKAEASERLERAYRLDPAVASDCVALRQWLDYQDRFPHAEAHARTQALLTHHRYRNPTELVDDVLAALAEKRGYSMIRVNDGEGAILHLSIDDEALYRDLYVRNRRHFNKWWFGHEENVFEPNWLAACKDFNAAVANADCLGAYILAHLEVRQRQGDVQNQSSLFNIVRKLEHLRESQPERTAAITLTDPVIHQFLLFDGELERLLRTQSRIGLVSWNPALPPALMQRFGFSEVLFHRTTGEGAVTGGVEPEPFGDFYRRLNAELSQAEPGVLYLVGAGIPGKVVCDTIKRAGGVALDVGSVVDIWMKAPTRIFGGPAENHGLAG